MRPGQAPRLTWEALGQARQQISSHHHENSAATTSCEEEKEEGELHSNQSDSIRGFRALFGLSRGESYCDPSADQENKDSGTVMR